MANNRLVAIVTMMILVGSFGEAQSEPTFQDLLTIDKMISDGDWPGLYSYVSDNPQLTAGDTALARELQAFKDDVDGGQLSTFEAATTTGAGQATRQANENVAIY